MSLIQNWSAFCFPRVATAKTRSHWLNEESHPSGKCMQFEFKWLVCIYERAGVGWNLIRKHKTCLISSTELKLLWFKEQLGAEPCQRNAQLAKRPSIWVSDEFSASIYPPFSFTLTLTGTVVGWCFSRVETVNAWSQGTSTHDRSKISL